MVRDFAGGFGLRDDIEKIVPFRIAKQVLEIAGQPVFDTLWEEDKESGKQIESFDEIRE